MEYYSWLLFVPLSFVLAWQDWKSRHVNVVLALITLIILALSAHHFYQSLWIFSLLWLHQYFRKNSIQLIDIALFSLGAGYFSIVYLPAYCLITAITLVALFKLTQKDELPFVAAWVTGFWGTYFLKWYVN